MLDHSTQSGRAPLAEKCKGFLITKVAPRLQAGTRVLYFGDFDFSGGKIEENTRDVLEREVGPLQWERLALTREQIEQFNLPVIVKADGRFKNGGGEHESVETEALSQAVIVDLLRRRLDALLPAPLADVLEREQRQRAEIRAILDENRRNRT